MMFYKKLPENFSKFVYKKSENMENTVNTFVPNLTKKHGNHFGKITSILLLTGFICLTTDATALANAGTENFSVKAEKLYFSTFMDIAKWAIIAKGGWDIVHKTLKDDFDGARRCVMQYLFVFIVLMGLPRALALVENIFEGSI